jgi:hypothetical protein
MIAQSRSVRYVHEPFNVIGRPCACGASSAYSFAYVCQENQPAMHRHIEHSTRRGAAVAGLLGTVAEVATTWRVQPAARYARSLFATRPLVKDPLAVFSAEWLVSTFGMNAVLVVRHPAAVVSSYKRLEWSQPFSEFLSQPALMREHLFPFEAEIRHFAENQHDIIDQASLLWKLVHHMIAKYRRTHADWIFVRHEDLSRDPVAGFRAIADRLNLEFSARLARRIQEHSAATNPVEADDPYSVRRNSQANIQQWRHRLTADEIARIRDRVGEVASDFYSDEEW